MMNQSDQHETPEASTPNPQLSLPYIQIDQAHYKALLPLFNKSVAAKLYLHAAFNCDIESGEAHRIDLEEFADTYDVNIEVVVRAAKKLKDMGLFIMKNFGGIAPTLPQVQASQQTASTQREIKQERHFYRELNREISDALKRLAQEGKDAHLTAAQIHREYDALRHKRMAPERKRYKWTPSEKGSNHVIPKLVKYLPKNSKATQELYQQLNFV